MTEVDFGWWSDLRCMSVISMAATIRINVKAERRKRCILKDANVMETAK